MSARREDAHIRRERPSSKRAVVMRERRTIQRKQRSGRQLEQAPPDQAGGEGQERGGHQVTDSIDFSTDQQAALDAVLRWRDEARGEDQYTTLGGYAGTGKTTLVSHLVELWPGVA